MEDNKNVEIAQRLDKIGLVIAESRTEAIQFKESCGIVQIWDEDEDHYYGIDEYNRHEAGTWRSKSFGKVLQTEEPVGSTIFPNITAPYCDGVAARIGDMLQPADTAAIELESTPVVELMPILDGKFPQDLEQAISEAKGTPEEIEQEKQRVMADVKQKIEFAKATAEKASKRIEDWYVEGGYYPQVRNCIEYCSVLGSGVLKGPIPEKRRHVAYMGGNLIIQHEIKPGSKSINPRNLFPDPACGESIHNGSFIWERDDITAKQLADLKNMPGYIDFQIDKVLAEGAHMATHEVNSSRGDNLHRRDIKNLYEIWYYHGCLSSDDYKTIRSITRKEDSPEEDLDNYESVHVQITMVNNRVIKMIMNPLDTGDFPYDVMVIKSRPGLPWGVGISRKVRTQQRMVVGASRSLMNNAGLASGAMIVLKNGIITPADGVVEVSPLKIWLAAEDASIEDVSKAITYITMPMVQAELTNIIQLAMEMAEKEVGFSMIMQGQMGANTPDRVGIVEILNQNASTLMRRITKLFNDRLAIPHGIRYYRYLMQYGEDDEKGEFVVRVKASSEAMVERQIEVQTIMDISPLAADPVYGLDPKKWTAELLRARRLDPKRFEYDDEEWKQVVEQMKHPPADPRVEVERMRSELKQAQIQSAEGIAQAKIEADKEIKAAERDLEAYLAEQRDRLALTMKEYDSDIQVGLSAEKSRDLIAKLRADLERGDRKIKADIGREVMKLNVQKELSGTNAATPSVEPKGRAPEGQSFQK